MRSLCAALMILVATATVSSAAIAPHGGSCRRPSKEGARFQQHVQELVAEDPVNPEAHAQRVADSLPYLSKSQVHLVVRDTTTCRRVIGLVNSFNATLISTGTLRASDSALVLSAGPVFIMQDPDQFTGEWLRTYVVDSAITRVMSVMAF
jgi:hypothetical protein